MCFHVYSFNLSIRISTILHLFPTPIVILCLLFDLSDNIYLITSVILINYRVKYMQHNRQFDL